MKLAMTKEDRDKFNKEIERIRIEKQKKCEHKFIWQNGKCKLCGYVLTDNESNITRYVDMS